MFEKEIAELNEGITDKMETCNTSKRTYTVHEIMDMMNLSRDGAYSLIKKNYFKSVRIGGRIRVSARSFDKWLDSQTE